LFETDEALTRLAAEDAQGAQLITLRYFAGLSVAVAAAAIGLARSTAYQHCAYAKVRLRCHAARGVTGRPIQVFLFFRRTDWARNTHCSMDTPESRVAMPADARPTRAVALGRLVQLYEALGKPDSAAEWRAKKK
jgi:hypothetical protein